VVSRIRSERDVLVSPQSAIAVTRRFETCIAAEYGGSWAVGVNSATSGLLASLLAIGVGPGDRVLVPGLSWPQTWFPASCLGARLVPVDLSPTWPVMDAKRTTSLLSPLPAAVVSAGLFGFSEGIAAIHAATRSVGRFHILDAAQLTGTVGTIRPLTQIADLVVVSLGPGKHGPACGGGGAVIGTDVGLHDRLLLITQHPLRVSADAYASEIRDAADGFTFNLGIHPLAARAYLESPGGVVSVDSTRATQVVRAHGAGPIAPPPWLAFPPVGQTVLATVAPGESARLAALAAALVAIGWTAERCPYAPINVVLAKRNALYPWLNPRRYGLRYSKSTLSVSGHWADALVICRPQASNTHHTRRN
jgi:hypothetical protein